jgi:hypothetical protein
MSRFGDAFRGVKRAGGWLWDNTLGRDDNPQFGPGGPGMGPGGPGIGPFDPTVMDPRMGPGMGPGMMDPGMNAYPGTVQQPGFSPGASTSGLYEPLGGRPSPWDDRRGGGFGDYLNQPPWYAGDTAQMIGGGLGAVGNYMGQRMQRQSAEEELALQREIEERHKEDMAFQKQKYADERADRAARHGTGPSGPIKWRQY